MLNRQFLDQTF